MENHFGGVTECICLSGNCVGEYSLRALTYIFPNFWPVELVDVNRWGKSSSKWKYCEIKV